MKYNLNLDSIKDTINEIDKTNPYLIDLITLKYNMDITSLSQLLLSHIDPIRNDPDLNDPFLRKKVIKTILKKYINAGIINEF